MSRHAGRRRWKRASRARARAARRASDLQHAAMLLGRQIVQGVECLLPDLPPVGVEPGPRSQQVFREVAVRIADIDRLRLPGCAIPVRDIVGAIRHDVERLGSVQFLRLPKDPTTFSVVVAGKRVSFRVAFTREPPRCVITLRVIYLLRTWTDEEVEVARD